MQKVAETPLIQVYWMSDVRAGYGIWTGLPRPEATRQALQLAENLLSERGANVWISNTKAALVSPPETQSVITQWLIRMHQGKQLAAWADLPPLSATARLVVKNLGAESSLYGIRFRQFAELNEAKRWVGAVMNENGSTRQVAAAQPSRSASFVRR